MSAECKCTMFPAGLLRRLVGLLPAGLLVLLGACDPAPLPQVDLSGRLLLGWRQNGAALTAESCAAAGLLTMEVDVADRSGLGTLISFSEVTCGLDRYPLIKLPLGPLRVQVRGIGQSSRKQPLPMTTS